MKNEYSFLNRINASLFYHAESWGILSNKYPKRILQKKVSKAGIYFEVENIVEANRVRFLDDESKFLKDLLDNLTGTDVLFDIGACIGIYSLHAAPYCKQVISFEPEPAFRNHLAKNIAINMVSNITISPYAISDRSSTQNFFTDGVSGKSPSLLNDGFQHELQVDARTLDDIIENEKFEFPTIIKMDIEGAEILALRGMEKLFKICPPRLLFMELHPNYLKNYNSNTDEVISIITNSNYQIIKKYQRDEQIHIICKSNNN